MVAIVLYVIIFLLCGTVFKEKQGKDLLIVLAGELKKKNDTM
ncbi:hypothetical protein bthur0004_67530 [Bacillus thuringiensis serovar sotto str. T04001]|nr:hypothetical protein bthur0004_67530 [Bacillus thuringiensis serovar sotto str. T04001]